MTGREIDEALPDPGWTWQSAAPRPDPGSPAIAVTPRPPTALEMHISALERAQDHLVHRAHAVGRSIDPDRLREILTRLRHTRARLVEARMERDRTTG